MREALKAVVGGAASALLPQCRYGRMILVIAHMRCGSTALSNILCSRPDISGYGETHVRHAGRSGPGRVAVNLALRRALKPRAPLLFDKILHSRHDGAAPPEFYHARAIFIARAPAPAIRSIVSLFARLGRDEYRTEEEAARYYIERMEVMLRHWQGFDPVRRLALTHAGLIAAPEAALAAISARLALLPPLENRYASPEASRRGGGGDPLTAGRFSRIEPDAASSAEEEHAPLSAVPAPLMAEAGALYARFCALT